MKEKEVNLYQQVSQALKQPPYSNPWLFDPEFLNFAEEITKLRPIRNSSTESIDQNWDHSVKALKKHYRIDTRVIFANGNFTYIKHNEQLDPSVVINSFNLEYSEENPVKLHYNMHIESLSPINMSKRRVKLNINANKRENDMPLSLNKVISCKRFIGIFRANLKPVLSKILRKKKRYKMPPLPKASQKALNTPRESDFQFMSAKSLIGAETERGVMNTPRPLPITFAHLLDTSNKNAKHRRAQSVVEVVESQGPRQFQLIRVQNSQLRN